MIPIQNLVAWATVAPWTDLRQIEQDLIISRAVIAIFANSKLSNQLRFRGGTALNKLHFPAPIRYSEDIDLVRTASGPIGPLIDELRSVLEPWLGKAKFDQSPVAPKLLFRVAAEASDVPIKLKIELNTREIKAYDDPLTLPFRAENPWFSGEATVSTFSREEMLATKFRALLQRDKGRDLFDLAHAFTVFKDLDIERIVSLFRTYMDQSGQPITRAEAEQRMLAKMANPRALADLKPLLSPDQAEEITEVFVSKAFENVFTTLVHRLPGAPWAKTGQMKERLGCPW